MELKKIDKQNICDIVFEQLQNQIISGAWTPGMKIPSETALSSQLGVSRVTVRNAFQRLNSLGLIEARQGGGTFVRDYASADAFLSLKPILAFARPDVKFFLEFRAVIEPDMTALAAERASEEQIQFMLGCVRRYEAAVAVGDYAEVQIADSSLHCMIAQATENPIIIKIYEMIKDIYDLSEVIQECGVESGTFYHGRIISDIIARNPTGARDNMRLHLTETLGILQASLKRKKEAEAEQTRPKTVE